MQTIEGLTQEERMRIRSGLIEMGFARQDATMDKGDGAYAETYLGPGATVLIVSWGPKKTSLERKC